MKLSIINKIVSVLIILLNLYFLPFTIIQIYTSGGPMGFGLMTLPFTFLINLLLIPAILIFKKRFENNILFLILNSFGLIVTSLLFFLLITTPNFEQRNEKNSLKNIIIKITPIISVSEKDNQRSGVKNFNFKNEHIIISNGWGNNTIKFIVEITNKLLNYNKVNRNPNANSY